MRHEVRAWWAVVVLVLQAAPAWAQSDATRAAARNLGMEGVEAFQSGNYVVANDKLGRAFEILRAPSLGLWSARALVEVGKLVEASERYLAVSRSDVRGGDAKVQDQAKATFGPTNSLFLGQAFWGSGEGEAPWFMANFGNEVWAGGSSGSADINLENPSMMGFASRSVC